MDELSGRLLPKLLIGVLVVLCSLNIPAPAWAQKEGFLYIDCGASKSWVDPVTSIEWVPDTGYIETGQNYAGVPYADKSDAHFRYHPELATLRYFDNSHAKNCYALPVTPNTTYLLRASFLNQSGLANESCFDRFYFNVSLDGTIIDRQCTHSFHYDELYMEYMIMPESNVTYLCLIRIPEVRFQGDPFISAISLRPYEEAERGMVKDLMQNKYIRVLGRWNYGADPYGSKVLRYPDDIYDRYWHTSPSEWTPFTNNLYATGGPPYYKVTTLTTTQTIQPAPYKIPPLSLFQSARTIDAAAEGMHFGLYGFFLDRGPPLKLFQAYVKCYIAELDANATATSRRFYIKPPNKSPWLFNMLDSSMGPGKPFEAYSFFFLNHTIDNMNLTSGTSFEMYPALGATMGPLLNALETFQVSEPLNLKTNTRDARAIETIKSDMNLTQWSGDPCLPHPHSWVTCTPFSPSEHPIILAVNLSGYQLRGTISSSFSQLQSLESLHLDNNMLVGELPDWLTKFPNLTQLSVQNNNFSGVIPPNLLSTSDKLNFTYLPGNPLLKQDGGSNASNATKDSASKDSASMIGGIVGGIGAGLLAVAIIMFVIVKYAICYRIQPNNNDTMIGQSKVPYNSNVGATNEERFDQGKRPVGI